ncbi:type VI secretion system tip protein VgrG [Cupriavidus sp. SZY C1]|uniref:type VI secretion system Vgr family protein n=1 Tax=Cupriavidus sp. SZY C1 TaxID=3055037 RepID=UPI0028B367CA|nr:type VI secretion system tip protein VgrG [Cupriavidus sp. SZY C1]MDT6964185.1 type VI secretion system tip protein VgrG [Cupriavidus sp. SZY C1]
MAGVVDGLKALGEGLRRATAHQSYFLEVLGAPSAVALSVVSFDAVERLGEPYTVTVRVTHPLPLDRHEYLRKDATFSIDPGDGSPPRQFSGCIFRFSRTRQTRDFHAYELEVRPKVALLTLTKASRVYQHQTAPQIIESILRRHGLEGSQFAFRTRRAYPEHKFRLQYQMSDWDYIRLLMEQEGLYSYFVPGKFGSHFGDVFQVCDDIDHYLYQPALRVPYRETAGLEAGVETVFDIQTHVRTVPESIRVADYNPESAYERLAAEANVARKEKANYGQSYLYGTHHLDAASATWEAQLRHEAALAGQIVYTGQSNVIELCPARILRLDMALDDAPNGQVITEVVHSGARDEAYRNTFKAIPSDRRFRLPIDESRWPRIAGTLSGRVTSPGDYQYAYLTQQGLYVVRLDLDFDDWPKGSESVPLRLAKPFAGARQTGFHFPLIDGTEVAVAFRDGDPNKPYIAHAHHHSEHEDLITNQDRWLSRNVIRTQSNNKLRFEDWEGEEGVKLSTDYGGKSQLNLGYLVDGQRKKRGEGFELRTSGWGAIRTGKGLYLTAHDQKGASGLQLDMQETIAELERALSLAKSLAAATRDANGEPADVDAQQGAHRELEQMAAPGLLASAPASVGVVSGRNIQLAAGGGFTTVAGDSTDINARRSITMAAGHLISLCAHKLGIKLFAAKGKVEIQAQSAGMDLYADRRLDIASVKEEVCITGKTKTVVASGGACITIENGSVEITCPGDFRVKAASFAFEGPANVATPLPILPESDLQEVGHYPLTR